LTLGGLWTDMDRPFHLTVQVKPAQLNTSSVNTGLIDQVKLAQLNTSSVKLAQHIFSQHWFDCSSQARSAQRVFI